MNAARQMSQAYVAGIDAIVEQQKLPYVASRQWVSEIVSAQSNVRRQLLESYSSAKGELPNQTGEATNVAVEASGALVGSSRCAQAGATKKRTAAVTKTQRRATAASSKSASARTRRSGPAKWTIEAYEALTAAVIVEQLPQFSQRELGEVETYEKAHKSRQTVLKKIASVRRQEPVAGYDKLNGREIHKQLAAGDAALAARVRDYERPRTNRDGVLNDADAQLTKS